MNTDELVDGWLAAWSSKDPDAFADVCTTDVSYEDPLIGEPLQGAAAIGEHAARLWAGFPDARVERTGAWLTDPMAPSEAPGFVAIPAKLLATHRADLEGLPPTGRFVLVHCVFYCELEHERLHRVRAFFDLYDAAVELGVLPTRGTLGEKALLMLRGFGLRAGRE